MDGEKYYRIFDLGPGASFKEVKKAYRNLAKIWHPDRLAKSSPYLQQKGEEKIREITEAYRRLEAQLAPRAGDHADFSDSAASGKTSTVSNMKAARFVANSRTMPGEVTLLMPNGDKYIGEFSGGKVNGNGTFFFANGDKYVGEFENNERHGHGMYFHTNGNKYVGSFKNGKPHGHGVYYYSNGDKYIGGFVDDEMNGQGNYTYANGDQYIGEYKNGEPHGRGTYTSTTGKNLSGVWENGSFLQ